MGIIPKEAVMATKKKTAKKKSTTLSAQVRAEYAKLKKEIAAQEKKLKKDK